MTPLRILLIMPNWLGDVVMTTPLIAFLHEAFLGLPQAERPEIHLAIRRPWASLFAADPRIASLLFVERNGRHRGLRGLVRQAREYRSHGFDIVLLGPPSLRAGLVAALARIPLRIGHASDGRGWLLNGSLAKSPRGVRHFSFDQLDLGVAALSHEPLSALPVAPNSWPLDELPAPALSLTQECSRASTDDDQQLWVVAPGTTYGEAKTWPVAQVQELIRLAHDQAKARVVLLGDAQAAGFVQQLKTSSELTWAQSLAKSGDVVDLTGKTNLDQVVSVLRIADGFVGNDSGLMHLAGALGVPTVGVFGSSNPDWTHPLGESTAAVTAEGFDCRPCYRKTCHQAVFCLTTVTAESVYAELTRLIAKNGQPEEMI